MPYVRFTLDLAIPQDVYDAIPAAKKLAARDAIRGLKALAVKVGDEITVRATYHICRHDSAQPCGPEVDV